jgi:hypothetical protein
MSQNVRDLLNVVLYLVAVTTIGFGLVGISSAAVRQLPDSLLTSHFLSFIESDEDEASSRISDVVATAREVRQALQRPIPGPPPLPPITAKLQHGGPKVTIARTPPPKRKKLSREAMEAMASTQTGFPPILPKIELHRVY